MISANASYGDRTALQRDEDRHRGERAEAAEQQHVVAPADAVGQRAEQRLHAHVDEEAAGHHVAGRLRGHAGGVDQVLLHVGGERVEDQRAAGGVAEHGQEGGAVVAPDLADAAGAFLRRVVDVERLVQRAAQPEGDHRGERADQRTGCASPRPAARPRQELLQQRRRRARRAAGRRSA